MTGGSVSPRNEKVSVKCKKTRLQGASYKIVDLNYTNIIPTAPSGDDKCTLSNSDPQSSKLFSTTDLISAVGYAWGYARKPLSVLLSKTDSTCKPEVNHEAGILHYSIYEGTYRASTSAGDHLNNKANPAEFVEEYQVHSEVNQKAPCPNETLLFWSTVLGRSMVIEGSSVNCLSSTEIKSSLGSMYRWMNERAIDKPKNQVNSIEFESKRTSNYYSGDCLTISGTGCVPSDKTSMFNSLNTGFSASKPEAADSLDLSFEKAGNFDLKPSTTTCSEIDTVHDLHIDGILTSGCDGDTQETELESCSYVDEDCVKESRNGLYEDQEDQGTTFIGADSSGKPPYAFAKQEHAFAGAMAGIFVSLSLHPVDTIKTVIQSCHYDQKPLHYIGRSIIAERGISGLYRGISSNIVSSAPISALYTFTYESVKKSLLPLLPKDYHSLAHCTAGGCASIATSFIFTPSERIKQQMQVGLHYQNCWNAFINVVQKGGLPSLYAGWGAVLCRNVPHSIIKFYTYESLKQIMLPSIQWNARTNILMTLVCGGLAGSMASLFSTPFDVVKTRLQTQIPGTLAKHTGVINTLTEIWKHEGLNGLYRGLTPRLVMYMIQGALFFASYESFKSLFSLEFPRRSAETSQHEHVIDDNTTVLTSTVSVTT